MMISENTFEEYSNWVLNN